MTQRPHAKKLLLSSVVVLGLGALLTAQPDAPPAPASEMATAAGGFLKTLSPEQAAQARFGFDDAERLNWHFIPRERKGLPLRDLEGEALKAAHALIRSGLSEAGYSQSLNIMSLEEVLFLLEGGEREYRRERRHPGKYYLSVFGEPGPKGSWGWRVEGHHLSLNYTLLDGKIVSSTPEFYGANPGTIDSGVGRQIRVLGSEEDIARQILKLANEEQQKAIWISKEAPGEVLDPGVAQSTVGEPVGLPVSQMSEDQKKMLGQLLSEYLQNMPAEIEKRRRAEIEAAGYDKIHFAWWGGPDLNQPHHYRVQGPTFLVEYNNVQNNANHVHSVWRDLQGDFNLPRKK